MSKIKKAVLYVRVNPAEKDKSRLLQEQEEALKAYCKSNKIKVLKIYSEESEVNSFARPEFVKMLTYFKYHYLEVDYLLFTSWDRFSEDFLDAFSMVKLLISFDIETHSVVKPFPWGIPSKNYTVGFFPLAPHERSANKTKKK